MPLRRGESKWGKERFLLAYVYSQDPRVLEWCTEAPRYLGREWKEEGWHQNIPRETQSWEPTEAAKAARVQKPIILRGYSTVL